MKCRTVQIEIGSGSELSPELRNHLAACSECRRFAAGLDGLRMLGGSGPDTPPDLRERTLDRCQELLAEMSSPPARGSVRRSAWPRWLQRLIDSPAFIAAFATASVIILVGVTALQVDRLQDKTAADMAKIFFVQLAVQNLGAALFLPALMFTKQRPGGRLSNPPERGA
jgi:hypothetical protein